MSRISTLFAALALWCGHTVGGEQRSVIFSDDFPGENISDAWEVHEGTWFLRDGVLSNQDGGILSLKSPPGGRFRLEFEIAFPSNWMSVIPFFTKPDDYGTLYLTNGYWESFEMKGETIANYIQRRDPDIKTADGFHTIAVESDYGLVTLEYDGKRKGPASLPYRPGARIAFRSLPNSGLLRIKRVRVH